MKTEKAKEPSLAQNWIAEEIELAHRQGIPASINGVLYGSEADTSIPVMLEQGTYMEDFVNDECGNIVQINFDRIRH